MVKTVLSLLISDSYSGESDLDMDLDMDMDFGDEYGYSDDDGALHFCYVFCAHFSFS